MPEIIVKLGDNIVHKHFVYTDQVTVGRSPDNDIAIENLAVSRVHASIRHADGHYIIEDNESANGTYVNGVRITRTEILDKDIVTIGKHKLHFYNQKSSPVPAVDYNQKTMLVSQPPQLKATLRIVLGKQKDQVFELKASETRIGRATDNDIRLNDWFVSKHHAVIVRRGLVHMVRDLASWRHTLVNGTIVQEQAIQSGDQIQFGPKITAVFELEDAGASIEGSGRQPVEIDREGSGDGHPSADEPANSETAELDVESAPEGDEGESGSLLDSAAIGADAVVKAGAEVVDFAGAPAEETSGEDLEPAGRGDADDSVSPQPEAEGELTDIEKAYGIGETADSESNSDRGVAERWALDEDASEEDPSASVEPAPAPATNVFPTFDDEFGAKENEAGAESLESEADVDSEHELKSELDLGDDARGEPETQAVLQWESAPSEEDLDVSAPEPDRVEDIAESVGSVAGELTAEESKEVAMWIRALQNPSKVIRKQAQRKLKRLTGRDYDLE